MYIGGHYDEIHSFNEFMKSAKFNLKIHGNAMQIFMGDRSLTTLSKKFRPTPEESVQIKAFLTNNHSLLVIHSNLRVNLAAPLKPRHMWNVDNIIFDMTWGKKIGAMGVVVHFGTRTLQEILQTEVVAEANMIKSIRYTLDHTPPGIQLLLEVNAGQPNKLGKTVKDIADIYDKLPAKYQRRIGFCLDTAHLFLAGYHMDTIDGVHDYFAEFKRRIGLKKLALCHLNDSALPFASGNDKHANLGKGYIYKDNIEPLQEIVQILVKNKIPMILETRNPKIYIKEIALIYHFATEVTGGGTRNENVEKIFKKMEIIHLILGNPYQARTYKNAANLIRTYLLQTGKDRLGMADLPKIAELEGIGKETVGKLEEIIQTGHLKRLDELLRATPYTEKQVETMVELEGVLGIGPKVARKMVDEGVTGVEDLKGRQLTTMQTMGFKYYKDLQNTIPRKEMDEWNTKLLKKIRLVDPKAETILAGSYRLGKKASGDIDLILVTPRIKTLNDLKLRGHTVMVEIVEQLQESRLLLDHIWLGATEIMGFVRDEGKVRHLDLRVVPEESLVPYVLYFGSGERFSRKIRSIAKKKGYKLTHWGLYDKAGKLIHVDREEDIFNKLGIPYVKVTNRLL